MKKSLSLLVFVLLFTGCSFLSKNSEVEYNNKIVELINQSSSTLEESATLYNESIPEIVTEATEVTITEMEALYDQALLDMDELNPLNELESRNLEQQNAVRPALETYESAGTNYLETYSAMLEYYGTGAYKTDITEVKTIDDTLHSAYTTFIQANNELVEILESFVASSSESE